MHTSAVAPGARLERVVLRSRWYVLLALMFVLVMWCSSAVQRKHDRGQTMTRWESAVQQLNQAPQGAIAFLTGLGTPNTDNSVQFDAPSDEYYVVGRDSIPVDKNYLYARYDSSKQRFEVLLRNLKSREIIRQWHLDYDVVAEIYQEWLETDKQNYRKYDARHRALPRRALAVPTLLPDGRLTLGIGPMVMARRMLLCVDANGKPRWNLRDIYHHSAEVDHEGNLWICSTAADPNEQYRLDTIIKLDSNTGDVLFRKPIREIFLENPDFDLSHLNLTERDQFHLNDVQPMLKDTDYWQRGDLFISLRNISTVLLYRPSDGRILWSNSTCWSNQHDVEVVDDHTITVFDNNILRMLHGQTEFKRDEWNRCMVYDFDKSMAVHQFADVYRANDIRTLWQGKVKWFKEDQLLYVEAAEQRFFVVADLNRGTSYKCVIPGNDPGKVGDTNWFRLLD